MLDSNKKELAIVIYNRIMSKHHLPNNIELNSTIQNKINEYLLSTPITVKGLQTLEKEIVVLPSIIKEPQTPQKSQQSPSIRLTKSNSFNQTLSVPGWVQINQLKLKIHKDATNYEKQVKEQNTKELISVLQSQLKEKEHKETKANEKEHWHHQQVMKSVEREGKQIHEELSANGKKREHQYAISQDNLRNLKRCKKAQIKLELDEKKSYRKYVNNLQKTTNILTESARHDKMMEGMRVTKCLTDRENKFKNEKLKEIEDGKVEQLEYDKLLESWDRDRENEYTQQKKYAISNMAKTSAVFDFHRTLYDKKEDLIQKNIFSDFYKNKILNERERRERAGMITKHLEKLNGQLGVKEKTQQRIAQEELQLKSKLDKDYEEYKAVLDNLKKEEWAKKIAYQSELDKQLKNTKRSHAEDMTEEDYKYNRKLFDLIKTSR